MRLTAYTDYTLRTLMYLGTHRDRLVTIQDIADLHLISKNHLMKVVHQLGLSGIVETVRGRNGGLRLAREPSEINIGTVVRETESDFFMAECFNKDNNTCPLTPGLQAQVSPGPGHRRLPGRARSGDAGDYPGADAGRAGRHGPGGRDPFKTGKLTLQASI